MRRIHFFCKTRKLFDQAKFLLKIVSICTLALLANIWFYFSCEMSFTGPTKYNFTHMSCHFFLSEKKLQTLKRLSQFYYPIFSISNKLSQLVLKERRKKVALCLLPALNFTEKASFFNLEKKRHKFHQVTIIIVNCFLFFQ